MRCSFDSATRKSETISLCGVKSALHDALKKLDTEFCRICHEGGRDWESGTTALVALITDKSLIIANLGDCRGILCRSAKDASVLRDNGWNALDNEVRSADETKTHPDTRNSQCVWKEVSNVHKPSDDKEKARIESANGWVTTETEIPFGQFRRMDLLDEDVMEIMRRCQKNSGSTAKECKASPQRILHISRVCGELAVSRALGDRDFKAAYHTQQNHTLDQNNEFLCWDSPLDLSFPDDHSRMFHGDLVDNCPDFHQAQIGEEGSSQEFLLLASDGLWVSAIAQSIAPLIT